MPTGRTGWFAGIHSSSLKGRRRSSIGSIPSLSRAPCDSSIGVLSMLGVLEYACVLLISKLVSTKKGGIDGELTVETREEGWKEFIAEHYLDQNGGKNLAEATQTRTSVDIFRWLKEGEEPSEDNRARIVLIRLGGYKDREVIKGSLQITDRVECPEFNKSERLPPAKVFWLGEAIHYQVQK